MVKIILIGIILLALLTIVVTGLVMTSPFIALVMILNMAMNKGKLSFGRSNVVQKRVKQDKRLNIENLFQCV